MNFMNELGAKWKALCEKTGPGLAAAGAVCQKAGGVLTVAGTWAWRLRKFIFAIPIVWLMIYFARLNYNLLPEMVGIDLQTTGEYARYITKEAAVYGPMGVTAGCLLMMMLSRRTLYPWLICLFSMALPILILITNIFPA